MEEGRCNTLHRSNMLKPLQMRNISLDACINFIQLQELIRSFNVNIYNISKIKKNSRCTFWVMNMSIIGKCLHLERNA